MENDTWKKDKDLENAKEIVAEFKRRISMEVIEGKDNVKVKDSRTIMLYNM